VFITAQTAQRADRVLIFLWYY